MRIELIPYLFDLLRVIIEKLYLKEQFSLPPLRPVGASRSGTTTPQK
jgi:hypothetical protein